MSAAAEAMCSLGSSHARFIVRLSLFACAESLAGCPHA